MRYLNDVSGKSTEYPKCETPTKALNSLPST